MKLHKFFHKCAEIATLSCMKILRHTWLHCILLGKWEIG